MKKIVTCCISFLSFFFLTAQPTFNSQRFSTQLKDITNYAKKAFTNFPNTYKLEGAIEYRLIQLKDGQSFYQASFANNISTASANKMESFLIQQITLALDDKYDSTRISNDGNSTNLLFISKCDCDIVLVRLRTIYINPKQSSLYIDIPGNKGNKIYTHNNNDITKKIKKIIVDILGVDEIKVTEDACFSTDLGADDLDKVEIIMDFEKEFNILISDEEANCIRTVGQAIAYLESRIK